MIGLRSKQMVGAWGGAASGLISEPKAMIFDDNGQMVFWDGSFEYTQWAGWGSLENMEESSPLLFVLY